MIVVDIIMPAIDGLELTRWLADRQGAARLIILTGYIDLYVRLAEDLGAAAGLRLERSPTQPISRSDLCAAISLVGVARHRRRHCAAGFGSECEPWGTVCPAAWSASRRPLS